MSRLSETGFWKFAATVPVATKDFGIVYISQDPSAPLPKGAAPDALRMAPWGTQRYVISKIFEGRARGVHQTAIHKGRQTGITEIIMLLGLYVLFEFSGLPGAFIADDDDNREFFRDRITQMALGAGEHPACEHDGQHPGGLRMKNKNQLAWDNDSRLLMQYAGVREHKKKKLGVGRGLAFLHATEAPIWLTASITAYLRSAFSTKHDVAIYVFEGTARGRNEWFDVWNDMHDGATTQALFAGPWLREDYRLDRGSDLFAKYWDGRLTDRERRWVRGVEKRFGVKLTEEFLAWRRWYVEEAAGGDDRTADQEMPVLPEDAFEATGQSFVNFEVLRRLRRSIAAADAPTWYRYEFGQFCEDTRLKRTIPSHGALAIWEQPQAAQGYVVAGTAAYTANQEDPTYVASVWRASRDELVQVAEFSDDEIGMQPFAWVLLHLAASYQAPRRGFILEVAGIGTEVLAELRRALAFGWGTTKRPSLSALVGGLQNYIWRRSDSMAGGGSYHWKSTLDSEAGLMNRLKDQLSNGAVVLRSEHCGRELERIRQDGNAFVAEGRHATSHHLHTSALAVEDWSSKLRPLFERVQGATRATSVLERTVEGFFDQLRATDRARQMARAR